MADSQIAYTQSTMPMGASHEVFAPGIRDVINHASPVAGLFQNVGSKGFQVLGKKLVISTQLLYTGGFIGTGGYFPDSEWADADTLEFTPAQTYLRRSISNFIAARSTGVGAFEDHESSIDRQAWFAIKKGTTRHCFGSSNATVCVLDGAAVSTTVLQVKDGYGHAGTNPLMYIEPGMKMALLDASASYAVIGVAQVASVSLSTKRITFASVIDASSIGVAGDPLVFVTTTDAGTRRQNERGRAPMGLRDILDPEGVNTSYGNIAESARPRIKPVRRNSVDFDEAEIMDFWGEIEAASGMQVTPETHVHTCQRAVFNQLARSLLPFGQFQKDGRELEGGWSTVRVAGQDLLVDQQHTHDELMTHCIDHYAVCDLEGEPHVDTSAGGEWKQLDDFDGREKMWKHYVQRFAVQRNASGTLKNIAVASGAADRFAAVPTST